MGEVVPEHLSKWVAYGLCGVAAAYVLLTIAHSASFPYPTPWWDHWDYLKQYIDSHSYLEFIWGTTTEHRLVGTRALLLLDLWWFNGDGAVVKLFSYLSLIGIVVMLYLAARRIDEASARLSLVAASVASLPLFFLAQWEALYLTTLVQVYLVNFLGLLCIFCSVDAVSSNDGTTRPVPYVASQLAGVFAALNFTTGILSLLIAGAIFAVRRGFGWAFWGSVIVLGATTITYLDNPKIGGGKGGKLWMMRLFEDDDGSGVLAALADKTAFLVKFTTVLFGGAGGLDIVHWKNLTINTITMFGAGVVTIVLTIWAGCVLLRHIRKTGGLDSRAIFWIALFVFALLSIAAVVFGRAGTENLSTATSSRYRVFSLFLLAGLMTFLIPRAWAGLRNRTGRILSVTLVLAVFAYFCYFQTLYALNPVWNSPYHEEAGLSIMVGTPDYDRLARSYPRAGLKKIMRVADWLKTQGKHMFADRRAKLMGQPLRDHYLVESETCGHVTERTSLPDAISGWRLFGWAWDVQTNRQGKGIVVADSDENIVGWGLVGYPTKLDPVKLPEGFGSMNKRYAGWKAYMQSLAGKDAPYRVYLVRPTLGKVDAVCPLASDLP